ncbi:ABC transporter permease [bacterium]|nr:MAG: ABC transporter permease [bacterium]
MCSSLSRVRSGSARGVHVANPYLAFAEQSLTLAAPLALAATAGYLSERSGVVNIALEGKMLVACAALALLAPKIGVWPALGVALAAAMVLALLHWAATQIYRIDGIISGTVVNALSLGGTSFAALAFPVEAGSMPPVPRSPLYVLAFVLPFLVGLYVAHTRGGLRLLASGSDPEKARLVGVSPLAVRFWALLGCGAIAGLGGAILVAETGVFSDGMTSGRGYIALAALILGGWRPIPTLLACIVFGAAGAAQIALQGTGGLPSEVWAMLPYLATLVALATAVSRGRAPAGLGKL